MLDAQTFRYRDGSGTPLCLGNGVWGQEKEDAGEEESERHVLDSVQAQRHGKARLAQEGEGELSDAGGDGSEAGGLTGTWAAAQPGVRRKEQGECNDAGEQSYWVERLKGASVDGHAGIGAFGEVT